MYVYDIWCFGHHAWHFVGITFGTKGLMVLN